MAFIKAGAGRYMVNSLIDPVASTGWDYKVVFFGQVSLLSLQRFCP